MSAAGAESVAAAAAQMNDPKSEDSEKSCENKSGERENKQSEPFVCLYLTATTATKTVLLLLLLAKNLRGGERMREEGEAGRGGGGGAPLQ